MAMSRSVSFRLGPGTAETPDPAHSFYPVAILASVSGNPLLVRRPFMAEEVPGRYLGLTFEYAAGATTPDLARKYGVHTATVHRAVTYETWRHV